MKNFIKRLFCKHKYSIVLSKTPETMVELDNYYDEPLCEWPIIVYTKQCELCGKQKQFIEHDKDKIHLLL